MHHGALHCKTNGIDFLIVHLHPESIKRRREEVQIITKKLENIRAENSRYIVLGDFNAHAPFDADLYESDGYLLTRLRESNRDKGIDGNIEHGGLDFAVISKFHSFPLYDVVQKYTRGMAQRGSFPTDVLGPVNGETSEQLASRKELIDYIFASTDMVEKCVDARIFNGEENGMLSDHYPVMAIFKIIK